MISTLGLKLIARRREVSNTQRRAFDQAVARAFATFARHYPQWAASFFDTHFLTHGAEPLLIGYIMQLGSTDPSALADAWAEQLSWFESKTRQARTAELIPAASCFLHWLEAELHARPEFSR